MKYFFLTLALLAGASSFAQGHNSAEHHRQWNPQHAGYDGKSNHSGAVIHIPNEVWVNYYGAIAADWSAGKGGFAENQRSAHAARRFALRQCGTRGCEIVATTVNGCLAVAFGSNESDGVSGIGAENSKDGTIQEAIRNCELLGGNSCQLSYLHCNHPVRIR